MAFTKDNFAVAGNSGNSNAPRIHAYKTEDALTDVDDVNYFNDLYSVLKKTDLIYVCVVTNLGASNEAVSDAGFFVVNDVDKGEVDVSDVTDIVVTDAGG